MAVIKRYAHLNHEKNDSQDLLDAASAIISGSLQVGAAGAANLSLTGSLLATQDISGSRNFYMGADAHIGATLEVIGDSTLRSAVRVGETGGMSGTPAAGDIFVAGAVVAAQESEFRNKLHVKKDFDVLDGKFQVVEADSKVSVQNYELHVEKGNLTLSSDGPSNGNATIAGHAVVQDYFQAKSLGGSDYALDVQGSAATFKVDAMPGGMAVNLGADGHAWDKLYVGTVNATTLKASEISASLHLYSQNDLVVQGQSTFRSDVDAKSTLNAEGTLYAHSTLRVGKASENPTLVVEQAGDATFRGADVLVQDSSGNEKLSIAAASGDITAAAGTITMQDAKFTGTGYALDVTNSASFGAVRVYGDLVVDGDQVILNTSVLQVEDYNITLVSGSHGDDIASGAGLTIAGTTNHMFTWEHNIDSTPNNGSGANAFAINDNWLPSDSEKFYLGKSSHKWKGLFLSGEANVGSVAVQGNGSITGVGALSAQSLSVTVGPSQFDGGIAMLSGTGSFNGNVGVTGSLEVTQYISASGQLKGASVAVDGKVAASVLSASAGITGSSLVIDHDAVFGGMVDLNAGATVPAHQTLTIALGATLDVQGTANYLDLSATGQVAAAHLSASAGAEITGSLIVVGGMSSSAGASAGSLTVGGINMSPVVAGTASGITTNNNQATLFTINLAAGEVAKLELEVLGACLRGDEAIASFKYSILAAHIPSHGGPAQNNTFAVELAKEIDGSNGPLLDVVIDDTTAGTFVIKADSSSVAHEVRWAAQIVKMIKVDAAAASYSGGVITG